MDTINDNTFYMASEQPTTCPKCGARTAFYDAKKLILEENAQIHECLSLTCGFRFFLIFEEQL